MEYRETYTVPIIDEATGEPTGQTREEVITYILVFSMGEGIKEFRLARNLTSHWEQLPPTVEEMTAERLVYDAADEVYAKDEGFAYNFFSFFTVRFYSYSNAEYLNNTCRIRNVGGGRYGTPT